MDLTQAIRIMGDYVSLDATLNDLEVCSNRISYLETMLSAGYKVVGTDVIHAGNNDIIRTAAAKCWETPTNKFPYAEIITAAAAWNN